MKILTANVVVTEPGAIEPTILVEGSTAPDWALPILGDHVLADAEGVPVEAEDEESEGIERTESDGQSDPEGSTDPVKIPNAPGTKGGSAKAWAEYALSQGFEIEGSATAQEIYDALAAEGVPVEAD